MRTHCCLPGLNHGRITTYVQAVAVRATLACDGLAAARGAGGSSRRADWLVTWIHLAAARVWSGPVHAPAHAYRSWLPHVCWSAAWMFACCVASSVAAGWNSGEGIDPVAACRVAVCPGTVSCRGEQAAAPAGRATLTCYRRSWTRGLSCRRGWMPPSRRSLRATGSTRPTPATCRCRTPPPRARAAHRLRHPCIMLCARAPALTSYGNTRQLCFRNLLVLAQHDGSSQRTPAEWVPSRRTRHGHHASMQLHSQHSS